VSKPAQALIVHLIEGRRSERLARLCEELTLPYELRFASGDIKGSLMALTHVVGSRSTRTGPKIAWPTSSVSSTVRPIPRRRGVCSLSHWCMCSPEQKNVIAGQHEAAALPSYTKSYQTTAPLGTTL
jgi:hypothetical protein